MYMHRAQEIINEGFVLFTSPPLFQLEIHTTSKLSIFCIQLILLKCIQHLDSYV